jgi:adenosylcobinamide kinase/adenosylcobinamide-phosphate guanylyltransferase
MSNEIILLTGGVKSGKSAYALQCGEQGTSERAFVATATARDNEMTAKIEKHRMERGTRWKTFEEPRDIAGLIAKIAGVFDVVLVDCLTLWVSNMLTMYNLTHDEMAEAFAGLVAGVRKAPARIVLVTNEVGLGVIPADSMSRSYQNLLGNLNRDIARVATSVYFMVSGVPLKMK